MTDWETAQMHREHLIPPPALHPRGLGAPMGLPIWSEAGMAVTRYAVTRGGMVICLWVYDGPGLWALALQAETGVWADIVTTIRAGGNTVDWRDGVEECLTVAEYRQFRAAVMSGALWEG